MLITHNSLNKWIIRLTVVKKKVKTVIAKNSSNIK